jgi:hypothetical protein
MSKIFNIKVALIGSVLINVSDMFLLNGLTNITTGSLVICYFLIILYFFYLKNDNIKNNFIILINITAIILTHQLTTFVVLVILVIINIGIIVYSKLNFENFVINKYLSNFNIYYIIYYIVLLIFVWLQLPTTNLEYSFFISLYLRLFSVIQMLFDKYIFNRDVINIVYINTFSRYSFISNILYNFGYTILTFFTIIGINIFLNKKYFNIINITFIANYLLLYILIYPATYIGFDLLLIPHRILVFLELFMIIISSYTIYKLINYYKLISIILITLLIFFMVTTPYIIRDENIYLNEREFRTSYKQSEINMYKWNLYYSSNEFIYTDSIQNILNLKLLYNLDTNRINYYTYSNITRNSTIILRNDVYKFKNYFIYSGTFGITYSFNMTTFIKNIYYSNIIYSNNEGRIYYIK